MGRFEAAPNGDVRDKKNPVQGDPGFKEDPGFKVVDKREYLDEAQKEAEEEIKKKKFDSKTVEQREEEEYKADKERGYTVKDKRGSKVEDANEWRKAEREKSSQSENSNLGTEPVRESSTAEFSEQEQIQNIRRKIMEYTPFERWQVAIEEVDKRVDDIEDELKKAKRAARMVYEYPRIRNELIRVSGDMENLLYDFGSKDSVKTHKEFIYGKAGAIRQRIFELQSEIDKSQNIKHPFRFFRKLFEAPKR